MTRPRHPSVRRLAIFALLGAMAVLPIAARQLPPDERLDLDLEKADLAETLRSLALIRDLTLDLGVGIEGSVTATLHNVPWSGMVETICGQMNLTCSVVDDTVLFVREAAPDPANPATEGQAISLSLRDADLFETLQAFGRIADLNLQIDPAVKPAKITVSLEGVPWPRALEGVCQLGNCRFQIHDGVITVKPLGMSVQATGIELVGERTDVATLFETFAGVMLFGQTVRTDIDPRARERVVVLDLEEATWSKMLDTACREAGCDWRLVFAGNEPLALRVRFFDERLDTPLAIPAFDGPFSKAVEVLATAAGLTATLQKSLDPDVTVHLGDRYESGIQAADALCAQVDCGWHLEGRSIVFRPRVSLLTAGAPVGSRAPRLEVHFTPPGNVATTTATARFSWAKTTHRVGSSAPGAWQLLMTWIPFAEQGHVVLPLVARCGSPVIDVSLAALPPATVPLETPWQGSALGAEVGLLPFTSTQPPMHRPNANTDCFPHPTASLEVTFPDLDRQALRLEANPGAYLLVTPPPEDPTDVPAPAAAVVVLGSNDLGDWSVGLVRPGKDDQPPTLERIDLHANTASETHLTADRKHRLMIQLQSGS